MPHFQSLVNKPFRPYDVQVGYKSQSQTLPLVVVQGHRPSFFGRNWLEKIKLDWNSIYSVHEQSISSLINKYTSLFSDSLGLLKDTTAELYINTRAGPKFFSARPVPYRLQDKIEIELRELQELGIITSVQHSELATYIVPIMKQDGSIRLCGDYKVINRLLTPDNYPLP